MIDLSTAILAINSEAKFSINGEDVNQITWYNNTTPISVNDIEAKQTELQAEYDANEYQRQRAADGPYRFALAQGSPANRCCWGGNECPARQLRARQGSGNCGGGFYYLSNLFVFWPELRSAIGCTGGYFGAYPLYRSGHCHATGICYRRIAVRLVAGSWLGNAGLRCYSISRR